MWIEGLSQIVGQDTAERLVLHSPLSLEDERTQGELILRAQIISELKECQAQLLERHQSLGEKGEVLLAKAIEEKITFLTMFPDYFQTKENSNLQPMIHFKEILIELISKKYASEDVRVLIRWFNNLFSCRIPQYQIEKAVTIREIALEALKRKNRGNFRILSKTDRSGRRDLFTYRRGKGAPLAIFKPIDELGKIQAILCSGQIDEIFRNSVFTRLKESATSPKSGAGK